MVLTLVSLECVIMKRNVCKLPGWHFVDDPADLHTHTHTHNKFVSCVVQSGRTKKEDKLFFSKSRIGADMTSVNDVLEQAISRLVSKSNNHALTEPYIDPSLTEVGEPVQYGLRATCHISRGTCVVWYGGKLRWYSELNGETASCKSHVRRMPNSSYVLDGNFWANQLQRPIPKDESERIALLQTSSSEVRRQYFDSVPDTEPLGWLANSPGTNRSAANVRVANARILDGLFTVPYLRAVCDIEPGSAILCIYGNERQHSSHGTAFQSLTASTTVPVTETGQSHTSKTT